MAKVNILIIEDEIPFSLLLKRTYSNIFDGNVNITFSSNFDDALLNIEEHAGDKYDLISLDLMLTTENLESYSGADCKTLIRKIHEHKSCNGLLVISGIAKINSSNPEFNSLQSDISNYVQRYFPDNHMFFNKISPEVTETTILNSKEKIKKLIKTQVNAGLEYSFFLKDRHWMIGKKGDEKILNNFCGLRYIHRLLLEQQSSPYDRVSCTDLFQELGCITPHKQFVSDNEKININKEIYNLKRNINDVRSSIQPVELKLLGEAVYLYSIYTKYKELGDDGKNKKNGTDIHNYKTQFIDVVNKLEDIYHTIPKNRGYITNIEAIIRSKNDLVSSKTFRTPEAKIAQNVSKGITNAIEALIKGEDPQYDLFEYFNNVNCLSA